MPSSSSCFAIPPRIGAKHETSCPALLRAIASVCVQVSDPPGKESVLFPNSIRMFRELSYVNIVNRKSLDHIPREMF